MNRMRLSAVAVCGLLLTTVFAADSLHGEERLLWPRPQGDLPDRRSHDPYLPIREPDQHVPPQFLELWLEALALPESDLQREAAIAIARAHRSGWLDCSSAAGPLLNVLKKNEDRLIQTELARTLITIDAQQAVPELQQRLKQGAQFARLVEPALAEWGGETMRDVWLERLAARADVRRFELLLAIRCLAITGEPRAAESLTEIIRDVSGSDDVIRLEAARSLGMVQRSGLESLATELRPSKQAPLVERIIAVRLLRHHEGTETVARLKAYVEDADDSVVALALERLLELDTAHVEPIAVAMLKRRDSRIRELTVGALEDFPEPQTISRLAPLLGDLNPDIRRQARTVLLHFAADDSLREAVLSVAEKHLAQADWHAIEQSAILLGLLKHTPAAATLLELVKTHQHARVCVASAWAVSMIENPDLLPEILEIVKHEYARIMAIKGTSLAHVDAVAHLIEAMGRLQYAPADPHLRDWFPTSLTDPKPTTGRAAAVWALGKIYEDDPDPEVTALLVQRVRDPMDSANVAFSAIVGLGWMNSKAAVEGLRPIMHVPISDYISHAIAWSDSRVTGKPMPPMHTAKRIASGWFLIPTDARRPKAQPED